MSYHVLNAVQLVEKANDDAEVVQTLKAGAAFGVRHYES